MISKLEIGIELEIKNKLPADFLHKEKLLYETNSNQGYSCLKIVTIIGDYAYLQYDRIDNIPLKKMKIKEVRKKFPKLIEIPYLWDPKYDNFQNAQITYH